MHHKHTTYISLMGLITIVLSAFIIQYISVSSDVAWLVECAQRTIDGGNYTTNIAETSTPTTYLLYAPSVILHRVIPYISLAEATKIWMWLYPIIIIMGSIHIIPEKNRATQAKILWSIYLGYICVSTNTIGEKDILGFMAIIPYAYRVAYQQKTPKISPWIIPAIIGGMVKMPIATIILAAIQWKNNKREAFLVIAGSIITSIYLITISPWKIFPRHDSHIYIQQHQHIGYCLIIATITIIILIIAHMDHIKNKILHHHTPTHTPNISTPTITITALWVCETINMVIQQKGWPYHAIPSWMCLAYIALYPFLQTKDISNVPNRPNTPQIIALCLTIFFIGNRTLTDLYVPYPYAEKNIHNTELQEMMDGWPPNTSWVYLTQSINDGFPYALYNPEHPWASAFPFAWFAIDKNAKTNTQESQALWQRYTIDIAKNCPYAIIIKTIPSENFKYDIQNHAPRLLNWIEHNYHLEIINNNETIHYEEQWIRNTPTCTKP